MAMLMPVGKQQFFDTTTGAFLLNGYIYTYAAGTSFGTPKATYTDSAAGGTQDNPIRLNARGEPANAIFWDGAYDIKVHDANDVLIYSILNYNTPAPTVSPAFTGTATFVNLTATGTINLANLNGGALRGFGNIIRNGNFSINNREKSGTVTLAAGEYGHDGWKGGAAGCTYTFATSGLDTTLTIASGSLVQIIEDMFVAQTSYTMGWSGTAQGKISGGSYAASPVALTATAGSNLTVEFGTGTLGLVRINPGSTDTPFERREFYEKLLSQRYLPVFDADSIADHIGFGMATGSGSVGTGVVDFQFLVEPRVRPTDIEKSSAAHFAVTSAIGAEQALATLVYDSASRRSCRMSFTVSGTPLTAGNATEFYAKSASGKIKFTGCEL